MKFVILNTVFLLKKLYNIIAAFLPCRNKAAPSQWPMPGTAIRPPSSDLKIPDTAYGQAWCCFWGRKAKKAQTTFLSSSS